MPTRSIPEGHQLYRPTQRDLPPTEAAYSTRARLRRTITPLRPSDLRTFNRKTTVLANTATNGFIGTDIYIRLPAHRLGGNRLYAQLAC
jgi:hypothetical protein